MARQGKSSGGPAPYGWLKSGTKVDTEAAEHIREAQRQVLAGVRISTIRRDWEKRGLGNPRKGTQRVSHDHVEHMLTSPRLCGYRTYHGEILLNDEGQPVIGEWETINTAEEWEAVCAAVAEHKAPAGHRSFARKYLLSGIARCGLCHNKVRGQNNLRWKPGSKAAKYTYHCSVVNGGCGKVGRVGEPVDDFIISLVLAEQQQQAARSGAESVASWAKADELAAVESDILELTQAAKSKRITVSTLLQQLPDLERQRDELRLERARFHREQRQAEALTAETAEDFRALPVEQQQAIIRHSLSAVLIHPAGRGARKFDPSLIEPVWR